MTVEINAENQILGRLATRVATVLRGKNKPTFERYLITGDTVLVYNAEKIKVTGAKATQKKYYRHSGYLGNLRSLTFNQQMAKNPTKVIEHAVSGMLPKNRLRKQFLKRLTIVKGPVNAK